MNVLEKILEEIETEENKIQSDLQVEVSQCNIDSMKNYIKGMRKIKDIVRSHMDDGKDEEIAKEVIDRISKFDCCNCPVKECDGEKDCDRILIDEILKIIKGDNGTDTITNNGWIPVEERLPEEFERVIAWDRYRNRAILVRYISGKFVFNNYTDPLDIIAWVSLPEPYKPKEAPASEHIMNRFMKVE